MLNVYLNEIVPDVSSVTKATARILRLDEWWGDRVLSDVSPTSCRAYVKHRNTAERTLKTRRRVDGTHTTKVVKPQSAYSSGGARRDLEELRSAINHHAQRELHSGHVEVSLPAKGKPRTKYMTRDEIARMLWVCWRHKRDQIPMRGPRAGQRIESKSFYDMRHVARFILVGVYTGSRTTPVLRASFAPGDGRAHLDLDAELYHRLPEDMAEAENKKSPTSRISPRLLAHLRRWKAMDKPGGYVVEWRGKPIMSVKTAWRQARTLAGVSGNPTPHTLRHTAVTWLKQQGVSSFDVAGFTGMSEQMVERVYGKHDPEFQRDVARRIGYRRTK